MSILSSLPLIGDLLNKIFSTVDQVILDKDKALLLKSQLSELQTQLNNIDAKNPNLFIAGWRPFVGWVCGVGLLYESLLRGILTWTASMYGLPPLPSVADILVELIFGMLGLGALRTFEKINGAQGNH